MATTGQPGTDHDNLFLWHRLAVQAGCSVTDTLRGEQLGTSPLPPASTSALTQDCVHNLSISPDTTKLSPLCSSLLQGWRFGICPKQSKATDSLQFTGPNSGPCPQAAHNSPEEAGSCLKAQLSSPGAITGYRLTSAAALPMLPAMSRHLSLAATAQVH